jgi:hypothetical protein
VGGREILWSPHDRPSPPVRGITTVYEGASDGPPSSSYFLLGEGNGPSKKGQDRVVVQGALNPFTG